jgi:hypothetical protein
MRKSPIVPIGIPIRELEVILRVDPVPVKAGAEVNVEVTHGP